MRIGCFLQASHRIGQAAVTRALACCALQYFYRDQRTCILISCTFCFSWEQPADPSGLQLVVVQQPHSCVENRQNGVTGRIDSLPRSGITLPCWSSGWQIVLNIYKGRFRSSIIIQSNNVLSSEYLGSCLLNSCVNICSNTV